MRNIEFSTCVFIFKFVCILFADRSVGKEYTQQFEDNCVKLEECTEQITNEIKERTALIELLEQSELFYDAQYGEAKIVANVSTNHKCAH